MKISFLEALSISRYGVIGIVSTSINYSLFLFFFYILKFNLYPSLLMGYIGGCLFSFHYGRTWIFGIRNQFKITQLTKFILSYTIGILILRILSNTLEAFSFNSSLKWLIVCIPIIVLNYLLLRLWVFKNNELINSKKWGGISKLDFLQVIASSFISYVNPAVIHNLEKYYAINKAFYLSSIEDIEGDYIEFGVFEGSSFSHAMRCYLSKKEYMPLEKNNVKFFGFDSFEGFGKLSLDEKHPFYVDEQFHTSYDFVKKKIERISKRNLLEAFLIKGFLKDTLIEGPLKYKIQKARIIFIDLDLYEPSFNALSFCKDIIQEGTILILDDFFSYRGSLNKGVARAFREFKENNKFVFREIMSYGMGGKVFICSSK